MKIGTTKNRGRKDDLDRFYSSYVNAKYIVDQISQDYDINDYLLLEPSAGNGVFVDALIASGVNPLNIFASDIEPGNNLSIQKNIPIFQIDFLSHRFDRIFNDWKHIEGHQNKPIFVIGNPPFGEQGTLCFEFINKSATWSKYITFILPPTFQKESYLKKINAGLVKSFPLPDSIYSTPTGDINVPSMCFIFDSDQVFTPEDIDINQLPFIFLSPSSSNLEKDADFTIRRVGGNAGIATTDISVSRQSNYFCQMKDTCPGNIVDIINECTFPQRDWTVGPRSLSKKEIAKQILMKMSL